MENILCSFVIIIITMLVSIIITKNIMTEKVKKWYKIARKNENISKLFDYWIENKSNGVTISNMLKSRGINSVAIYGLGIIGQRLYSELKYEKEIDVKFAIDKNKVYVLSGLDVYEPDDAFPDVDIIIVTAISFFDVIKTQLLCNRDCNVVSLEEIIYEWSQDN